MRSPADADLARRDPALPGLGTVLDPDAFGEALRAALPVMPDVRLRAAYVRYKPGTSCLVGYRFDDWPGLAVVATSHRADAADKLAKAAGRPAAPTGFGPGRLVLPGLATAVAFFPNDDGLEVLPRLMATPVRRAVLGKLFPLRPILWAAEPRILAYKPGRRFVAALGAADAGGVALKAYAGAAYRVARENVRAFRSQGVLRIGRCVGRSERHGLLALEWLPGRLLTDELAGPDFDAGRLNAVGVALAELHGQGGSGLRPRPDPAAALDAAAAWVCHVCPELAGRAASLAARLGDWLRDRPPADRPVHGDFYAKQVVMGSDGVGVLDLDEAGRGDPALDLGMFLAHLERDARRGLVPPDRVEPVCEALLAGYRTATGGVPDGVPQYTAAGLLQLAPHPFRNREADWPDRTAALLERAGAILAAHSQRPVGTAPDTPVEDSFDVGSDARMPFLRTAVNPPAVARLLREHGRLRAVRVVRHKPGRRCLIEYDLDTADGPLTLVGKARAKGTDRRTPDFLRALRAAGLDGREGVGVPEPAGVLPELHMGLHRKVPGTPTTARLADGGPGLARRVAEAAHRLHTAGVPGGRPHAVADELDILDARLADVAQERPDWSGRLDRVLAGCRRLAGSLPTPPACGVHRDFHPDQVLADGPTVWLLDFDLYCQADPALDVGNFLAHLTELAVRTRGGPDGLGGCEAAMEERYLELTGVGRRAAVRAYALLTLARHVAISRRFPDRRPFTARLLDLCEERLGAAGCLPPARRAARVETDPRPLIGDRT